MSFVVFPKGPTSMGSSPAITCRWSTIVFNPAATEILRDYTGVVLLWDKDARKCAAKPLNESAAYQIKRGKKSRRVQVTCTPFLRATRLRQDGWVAGSIQAIWNIDAGQPEVAT